MLMKRYPNGIGQEFFFQKNATHFPDWMRLEPITEHHPPKVNQYPIAENRASLLYLVNLGCIDQNPWMSRAGNLSMLLVVLGVFAALANMKPRPAPSSVPLSARELAAALSGFVVIGAVHVLGVAAFLAPVTSA